MKKYLFTLISFLIFLNSNVIAFTFRHYKVENGLSENSVFCSLQDSKGFMWFGTKDGLNRFDGHNFAVFHSSSKDKTSIGNNFIRSLHEDKHHTLWVGTEKGIFLYSQQYNSFQYFDKKTDQNIQINMQVNAIIDDNNGNLWIASTSGLFKYNTETLKLTLFNHNPKNENSLSADFVSSVICDSKGDIWAGTLAGGLSKFIPRSNSFKNFSFTNLKAASGISILKILEDSQGNLILGTLSDGLIFFDRNKETSLQYLTQTSQEKIFYFRDIFEYSPGIYLVGSENGLIQFEKSTGKVTQMKSSTYNTNTISDNAIYSIYKDREGGIWVGTYFGGVNYISPKTNPFEIYVPTEYNNSVSGKAISQFCEDSKGNLWIGTEDGGLNYFDIETNKFKYYNHIAGQNSLSYHNVHSLMLDGNNLWIGTFVGGLNILNTNTGQFKYYTSSTDIHTIDDNNVFSIYKDLTGTIWVGTIHGLNRYNPVSKSFDRITALPPHTHVYDILQDHFGLLWITTYTRGIFCFNPKTNKWKQYLNDSGNSHSLSHNKVISVFLDDHKRLWFGTEGGGLCQYNYDKDNFTTYDVNNGIPNNVVYMVVPDHDYLWISTNKGLVRFNPENNNIKIYTKSDGLQGDQFNFKSAYKARNGKIYFGGTNGFNAFYPEELRENKYIPSIAITNFQLFNKDANVGQNDSPLKESVTFTDEIRLNYNQSFINFEFVALSYCIPEKNQYAYKLENFDKDWNNIGNNHKISYTSLPSGTYTLHIKGSNNDGLWNNDGIKLIIKVYPPFWRSIWAYILYLICLITGSYYLLKRTKVKNLKEQQIKLDKIHADKEIELYNAKIDFFTNIAHEIRTPLSLIKAPLDYILKKYNNIDMQEYLSVMDRNTNRLLSLVNQLLDFRKAEKNSYSVNFKQTNINELLHAIYDSFKYFADSRTLEFKIEVTKNEVIVQADAECLNKIISNLLSNAIKHAKTKVVLSLISEEEQSDNYKISVYDDGDGINSFELEKIFQPFYQIKNDSPLTKSSGTGIGLALVKLLVEIHGGKINVQSEEHKFACFTVEFPINNKIINNSITNVQLPEEIIIQDKYIVNPRKEQFFIKNKDLPSLLVVEDNEELNQFVVNYFQENFSVISAINGVQAIKILENFSPDLIISDIVMPELDGLELCQYIKTNTLFSHIPIILLTAKTDIKYKIEGLEYGADAYFEKPFSVEHLEAQVINLLESREKLKTNFIYSPLTAIKSIGGNKADETFLVQITEIIEANITDVNLSVEELSLKLAMSRSNLHRKVKGISGLAPNDFIRLVKLKKAVRLMTAGENRINEICYLVGFNTPSYFAKCFQKQFGILPKDFIKK